MKSIRLVGDLKIDSQGWSSTDIVIGKNQTGVGRVNLGASELTTAFSDDELDLIWIAGSMFRIEEVSQNDYTPEEVLVEIAVTDPQRWMDTVEDFNRLISMFTGLDIDIRFRKGVRRKRETDANECRCDAIVPFSGGVDSLSGILLSRKLRRSIAGFYVSHSSGASWVVRRFKGELLDPCGIPLHSIGYQNTVRAVQQSRGFVYLAGGGVVGNLLGAHTLDLTECGVTMYQPPLLANDVVTVTTHPDVVSLTMGIVRKVLGSSPRVCEPFEDLTKAEVMAACPEPSYFPLTHSCVSSQFVRAPDSHCGMCWGCLIKHIGAIVAGVGSPGWAKNVLELDIGGLGGRRSNEKVTANSLNDLLLLLDFASRCLEDRLPWWTRSKIDEFGKSDLYRRSAMDVFAALNVLCGDGSGNAVNRYARKAYTEGIESGIVSRDDLENRLAEVREEVRKPDFDHIIAV